MRKLMPRGVKVAVTALISSATRRKHRLEAKVRRLKGPQKLRPVPPDRAQLSQIHGISAAVWIAPYDIAPHSIDGVHPVVQVPKNWKPLPNQPLETSLPYTWDQQYKDWQPFQPVKVWRNAIALKSFIETTKDHHERAAALEIVSQLLDRMKSYTVWDGDAAFIENRFTDPTPGTILPPGPWVSAIGNAFAILANTTLAQVADTKNDTLAYARAFEVLHKARTKPPERWITVRDKNGYLWFDEYPRPKGKTTRVKNGHIFAVLALHEASLMEPSLAPLVSAGATTIDAYALSFRRPKIRSRYALDYWFKGDYLPNRAIRQLFQLHALTGAESFISYGDLFLEDCRANLSMDQIKDVSLARKQAAELRAELAGLD